MTATHVNGLAVIADEAAPTNITNGAGERVYFRQIRKLLLEDDSIAYGCVHCEFTGVSTNSVRPHLSKHSGPAKPKTRRPKLRELTIDELMAKLENHERVAAERDNWRVRALKAEGQLRSLRNTLRGDG